MYPCPPKRTTGGRWTRDVAPGSSRRCCCTDSQDASTGIFQSLAHGRIICPSFCSCPAKRPFFFSLPFLSPSPVLWMLPYFSNKRPDIGHYQVGRMSMNRILEGIYKTKVILVKPYLICPFPRTIHL